MTGSIVTVAISIILILDGLYAAIKGENFSRRGQPVTKHDPAAHARWMRVVGVMMILCGAACAVLTLYYAGILQLGDSARNAILIAILAVLVISIVSYFIIVKPADRKYFRNRKGGRYIDED